MTLAERMRHAIEEGPHGKSLLDRERYRIDRKYVVVDADVDYVERDYRYDVSFYAPDGSVIEIARCETHVKAKELIEKRCSVIL